tara:strand:+ start:418 stop:528 length:111 start_codon:yes stop_codon:yes gene_type:complete
MSFLATPQQVLTRLDVDVVERDYNKIERGGENGSMN